MELYNLKWFVYRQIFDENLLSDVLFLQPQFEIGASKYIACSVSTESTGYIIKHYLIGVNLNKYC